MVIGLRWNYRLCAIILIILLATACSSWKSHVAFYENVSHDLAVGNYQHAEQTIDNSRDTEEYKEKDRVLYYLDKAILMHYQQEFQQSNDYFNQADNTMEELFTRSISRVLSSLLINDNVQEYSGEIYENIYVNVFKAINYLKMNQFDDAYVEIRRVNEKLVLLDDQYGKLVEQLNQSDSMKIKITKKATRFYDDVLAHYLSYLIFRAEGEYDNSRISFEKIRSAQAAQNDVYDYQLPAPISGAVNQNPELLNIIAFIGKAPAKEAVGGQITTYDNYVHISDLSYRKYNQIVPIPGIDDGYHFKFSFPELRIDPTAIVAIDVVIDNRKIGRLELLEDMGKIATNSFETKHDIIFFKTISRVIVKGLASKKAKDKLQKEMKAEDNFIFKSLLNLGVDMAVDATEHPDLRCWRTMPGQCYIGEFEVAEGKHIIEIRYYNHDHLLVKKEQFNDFVVSYGKLNLLESVCLN
jgi:hypothetical protein